MSVRAVIIGVGNSGSRFIKASHFIDPAIGKIDIVGVADADESKLKALIGAGVPLENDFRKLLRKISCDIIIISTTDDAHFEVLKYIKENSISFKKIICEKPIVIDEEQSNFVERSFGEDQIYISFVERYSLAVSELKRFILEKRRSVSSVSFVWSKYRVKDARPTVGVTSEITHPVDLACYIAGVGTAAALRSTSSIICESDFVQGGMQRPETILACVDFADGMVLTGISSYIRSERCRTMEFVLSDATSNVTEIAVLRLDSPKWDDDYLTVFSTASGASPLDLALSHATPPNKNKPRRQIDKICRFLEDVVSSINGAGSPRLPNKSQALLVQDIVRRLEDGHIVSRKMFSDEAVVSSSDGLIHLEELAVLMKSGASEGMRNDWNDQY